MGKILAKPRRVNVVGFFSLLTQPTTKKILVTVNSLVFAFSVSTFCAFGEVKERSGVNAELRTCSQEDTNVLFSLAYLRHKGRL